MANFDFQSEKAHFTYKTHMDEAVVKTRMKSFGDIKIWSFVHEDGDTDEDTATPYEHTHVFVWWKKRPHTRDARAWDIDEIHPNLTTKRSMKWAKNICMKYHLGHKTKKNGKKYFIEPIFLSQEGCEDWKFEEELITRVMEAPTLKDACIDAGVEVKSVSDCVALRKPEAKKRKFAEIDDECDVTRFKTMDWDRSKALVMKGNAATGKTNWAVNQFKFPVMICDVEDMRNLPAQCDGLVFDEMLFDNCSKKTQVYLTDLKFERTIRMRHCNASIPKGLPRIFCCNEHEFVFGLDPHESVKRRFIEYELGTNGNWNKCFE